MSTKVALIVPSIREESFRRFITEWAPTGLFDRVDLILMEDNPTKTFPTPLEAKHHLCWEDIDKYDWSYIIPRRSDTVRSFAYWYAWHLGYEFMLTLDDDCYPIEGIDWDNEHIQMLEMRTKWYNTLNATTPRGIPYYNQGQRKVYVNHGLWQGVLDYDAPHQLVNPEGEVYDWSNKIVPGGAYFPMCGMNVAWRREATVLMYHLLMGRAYAYRPTRSFAIPGSKTVEAKADELSLLPFDRFGDIWCGILMKKIADHLQWAVSTGTPYIHHDRASNPFTNLRKEANGIEVNENFWQWIDDVKLVGTDPTQCYRQLALAIEKFSGEHAEYWKELGNAMLIWADLFDESENTDDLPF